MRWRWRLEAPPPPEFSQRTQIELHLPCDVYLGNASFVGIKRIMDPPSATRSCEVEKHHWVIFKHFTVKGIDTLYTQIVFLKLNLNISPARLQEIQ